MSALQELEDRKEFIGNAAFQAAEVERMRRGSNVLTDDDIKRGFQAVLKPGETPLARKVAAHLAMLFGTAGVSMWSLHFMLPVFGGLLCIFGVLIREYRGK